MRISDIAYVLSLQIWYKQTNKQKKPKKLWGVILTYDLFWHFLFCLSSSINMCLIGLSVFYWMFLVFFFFLLLLLFFTFHDCFVISLTWSYIFQFCSAMWGHVRELISSSLVCSPDSHLRTSAAKFLKILLVSVQEVGLLSPGFARNLDGQKCTFSLISVTSP